MTDAPKPARKPPDRISGLKTAQSMSTAHARAYLSFADLEQVDLQAGLRALRDGPAVKDRVDRAKSALTIATGAMTDNNARLDRLQELRDKLDRVVLALAEETP